MNFHINNISKGISYIWVRVTDSKIVIKLDNEDRASVFEHHEYESAVDSLSKYFNDDNINDIEHYIEQYIIDNLEHKGVKVIKRIKRKKEPDNGNQLSLF